MSQYAKVAIPFVLAGALVLGGCENMDHQTQHILSGGAIGAATGATVTVITGGAVGTGVGYVVNEMEKK